MDYAITSSIFTLVVFVVFIGIVLWAYSSRSKARFEEAANLVFDDEKKQTPTATKIKQESSAHE